jgi:hypothetical protein
MRVIVRAIARRFPARIARTAASTSSAFGVCGLGALNG